MSDLFVFGTGSYSACGAFRLKKNGGMFCPSCGKKLVEESPNFCSGCGERLYHASCIGDTSLPSTSQTTSNCPTPTFSTFIEYRKKKNEERQKFSEGRKGLKKKEKRKVQINVGLMTIKKGGLKPYRGKTIFLTTDPDATATSLLNQAVKKMKDFNKDLKDGPFLLLYPDGTEVITVPGTQRPFTLEAYKAEVGKPYQRITVFICLKSDFEDVGENSDLSDSDPEIVIKRPSEFDLADTLPWELQHESSPLQKAAEYEKRAGDLVLANEVQQVIDLEEENDTGTTKCLTVESSCYRNYTQLFEPIVIDDEDPTPNEAKAEPPEEPVDTNLEAHEIIANLALELDHKKVSRFNISRSAVWDGAVRGFRRSTYSDNYDMFIKFNDDAGSFEDGLDTGGPRREFLTLLMGSLRNRPIFDGPPESRYLVYNSRAARQDEYFLAGKMIAVSIVHGGPAPHFLSKNLVNHITGNQSFSATVEDVQDEEITKVLHQVLKAESEESLHNLILQNSTIFQTAGCLRNVKPCEKQAFVEEYLRWYILERNQSVIQRFKDGLESLNFLSALQKHSSVLAPLLCFSAKALTASELESMFRPDLSPAGSNKRHKEVLTLGFWADYLLDCEEKATAVCLEDLMMFATGLTAVPPAGMTPPPCIQFLSDSPFPVANTCANTLKLPICDSYGIFKANMDFGIQNAPGFGCS
ncbi:G2/M phase-specific E3 ubiquitin-protein ligase-like [Astatotilapia calliptera]|uniref:G2/M phase-specific E3 ubiquitin-protein ligase-like n=1 Tax=Astatotilapia calliptera TaxID=8154 RepID=UPI000E41F480|nr:G2/M phase-specific E3 ubiquitin-protein ligase-like [Astatotilapia calliptera]